MMGLYEGILGIKRDYDGLRIDPCFPKEWEKAEATRHFREADYHIVIHNPDHLEKGKLEVCIDGVLAENGNSKNGSIVPDFRDGKMHEIYVTIRIPKEQA